MGNGTTALIEDLFVYHGYRRAGYGLAITNQLIDLANLNGCSHLVATSRQGRDHVHQMYSSCGLISLGSSFRLDL